MKNILYVVIAFVIIIFSPTQLIAKNTCEQYEKLLAQAESFNNNSVFFLKTMKTNPDKYKEPIFHILLGHIDVLYHNNRSLQFVIESACMKTEEGVGRFNDCKHYISGMLAIDLQFFMPRLIDTLDKKISLLKTVNKDGEFTAFIEECVALKKAYEDIIDTKK